MHVVEPARRFFQPLGARAAEHSAPDLLARHQTSLRQHAHVLQHRRQRHLERPREIADRQRRAARQSLHDRPSGRIGESGERYVQAVGDIVNHMV